MRRFPIDAELAGFLAGPVAIVMSTRDANMQPHVARAYAGHSADSEGRFGVHIPTLHAEAILSDVADNGSIAVVFSRVHDFKTYQLIGNDVVVGAPIAKTTPVLASYFEGFLGALEQVGMTREAMRGFEFEEYTPLLFTATACFAQTPGPGAGQPVEVKHG